MPIAFVALNITDAYLTQLVLSMGGVELNPLAEPFGSNMLVRGLLAVCTALVILLAGKRSWLRILTVIVLFVVVWNLWQYTIANLYSM
jgi:glucose dehydrogenase